MEIIISIISIAISLVSLSLTWFVLLKDYRGKLHFRTLCPPIKEHGFYRFTFQITSLFSRPICVEKVINKYENENGILEIIPGRTMYEDALYATTPFVIEAHSSNVYQFNIRENEVIRCGTLHLILKIFNNKDVMFKQKYDQAIFPNGGLM